MDGATSNTSAYRDGSISCSDLFTDGICDH